MAGEAAGAVVVHRVVPDEEFVRVIPHEFARRHLILGVEGDGGGGGALVAAGTRAVAVHNAAVALGRALTPREHPAEELAALIDRAYASRVDDEAGGGTGGGAGEAGGGGDEIELGAHAREEVDRVLADADLLHTEGKGPIPRLIDLLLFESLQRRASDLHLQPVADRLLVRLRLDGVLHVVRELPSSLSAPLVSRIKVMARLDVAEKRAPQDGRATVTVGGRGGAGERGERGGGGLGGGGGRRVDLRISTLPTTYGERVVIRVLDASRSAELLGFDALGMPAAVRARFEGLTARTSGIILVTGPTGSGKTTTLYTALAAICHRGAACPLNIITIEDPVEYDLATIGLAVSQTQLSSRKGVTFAAGLRHILRQDPDVIMVGEVRDEETARVAVQASLTGHLVLSTLHTNDAPSAVSRLLDLEVEPYLASSSLAAVLAQRLVRRLHAGCRGKGKGGCEECFGTGFLGRTGLFELLVVDEAVQELILKREPTTRIRAAAIGAGMTTLQDAGRKLVESGGTTSEEVARAIEGLQ